MKGISPLIAAVLLIAFTMAIAALVGVFGTTFSKGETEKISSSAQCVGALQIDPLSIRFSQITRRVTGRMTNYGKGTLDNFLVTVYYPDSTSITKNITDNITAGSSKALSIHTGTRSIPEKVSVFAENCGPSYSASLKISSDKIITGRYDYTQDPNLIAAWSLDEASGTRTATWGTCGSDCDLSDTNGVGQDTMNYMEGGAAAYHDPSISSQYLTCTDANCNELKISDKITYGCWARKLSGTNDNRYIIDKRKTWSGEQDGYLIMWLRYTYKLGCQIGDGTDFVFSYSNDNAFPEDLFVHTVCRYDNSNSEIQAFINGQTNGTPATQQSLDSSGANVNFGLGANGNSGASPWDGQLDECFVFNRALKSEEICEICRFGLDGTHADRGVQCSNCGYV